MFLGRSTVHRISRRALILTVLLPGLLSVPNRQASAAPTITITLGSGTVSFPGADPATTPSVAALENPISVTVTVSDAASPTWVLTVLANGDLASGGSTIPVSKVSWTATGAAYNSGTLSKTSAQTVGQGFLNGAFAGTLSFFFQNGWEYASGNYSCVITYTATML